MSPMLIGAGIGAATSLLGGSKQAGVTKTTQDIPDWLKPYVTGNLNMATGTRDATVGAGTPVLDASQNQLLNTMGGSYLTPTSNPYLVIVQREIRRYAALRSVGGTDGLCEHCARMLWRRAGRIDEPDDRTPDASVELI